MAAARDGAAVANGDAGSAVSPPSLLRVGLSAGFSSLSRQRGGGGGGGMGGKRVGAAAAPRKISDASENDDDGADDDGSLPRSGSLLSPPEEEEETLAAIQNAVHIGQKRKVGVVAKNDSTNDGEDDLVTLAALTALGDYPDYSHSSKGVLVNVIDPTTKSGNSSSFTQIPAPHVADTPPQGGKVGLFSNFSLGGGGSDGGSNGGSSHGESSNGVDTSSLKIYPKLAATFSQNYDSTLHSLPYVHPRTSVRSSVPSLPVRFDLAVQPVSDPAEWHDGPYCHVYIAATENIDHYRAKVRPALRAWVSQIEGSGTTVAGGGATPGGPAPKNLSRAASPGAPPPASPAAKGGKRSANEKALARAGLMAGKSAAAGNFGSRYIIVFVPVGPSSPGIASGGGGGKLTGGGGSTNNLGGGGFGGFRGRKGQSGGVILSNSAHGGADDSQSAATGTTASSSSTHDLQHAAASAALPPGRVAHSSKEAKELFNKFVKDFPNGKTVILGTLLDGSHPSAVSPLKNQEWKAFLHNLGGAIVDGFQDRVKRYDEELRRLDSRRAAFVRKLSGDGGLAGRPLPARGGPSSSGSDDFDLSHFFLVKESLAFTYEQMQLFEEAKLQYEELNAFLPEDAWRTLAQRRPRERPGDDSEEEEMGSRPSDLAMAGDSPSFRRHIRDSGSSLRDVSHHVPRYLYAREVRLLFRMGLPVDALTRSRDFLYSTYRDGLADVEAEFARRWKGEIESVGVDCEGGEILRRQAALRRERLGREARVEAWALSSCWDIRCAAAHYFAFDGEAGGGVGGGRRKQGGRGDDGDDAPVARTMEEVEAARCLAELLEFGMLRLMRLGDLSLSQQGKGGGEGAAVNPIRRATSERPVDTLKPWEPWRSLKRARGQIEAQRHRRDERESESRQSILHGSGRDDYDDDGGGETMPHWLLAASSPSSRYELVYLELAGSAADLNRLAGRHRSASRLEDQRAEVLIARGEHSRAARVLSSSVAGGASRDQWTRAHYWRIFRLACCQRMSGDVLAYLETLTQSFNPKLKAVAPPKTASLFQRDLEAIITDAAVAEPRWGAFPFLETELSIASVETEGGRSTMPLPFLRRKLTKHLCFVGDELKFSLKINSHLPRPIAVNGLRLYLVRLTQYEVVYRRNGIVGEDDAFRILTVDSPINILPGNNEFSFSWRPMTYDTYVLATVEIQWKEASFFYDSALLRKPMIGMDVQPSEPTQTIELNPLFLIPGHVQNVRLVFHSGSDVITEGRVRLVCSKGLMVVPPRTDPAKLDGAWSNECVIPLDACSPGKKVVITTLVKSSTVKHEDAESVQTMRAVVETRYRQESYDAVMREGEEPESDPMNTLLEAMVTTLDRPALTVDEAQAFMFGDDHVIVNISLQCNSPVPFYIKEWHLDLPPPFQVEEDGDLNKDMFRHAIPEGEVLLLGFRCIRVDSFDAEDSGCEKPLLRVVLQDDFGKTFLQVLPVNLEEIYQKLKKEDVYDELYTATAELTCSAEEGTVGHPVPFAYDLNLQSLMTPRQRRRVSIDSPASISSLSGCHNILYTIISDGTDWIVSGKVQGLIKLHPGSEMLQLQFRGIPTQSGILQNFPELYLEYLPSKAYPDSSAFPPITVQCKNPDSFQSYAYTTSLSLAVPATLDEF